MDLDTLIIAVFCWIDEARPAVTQGQRLRQRGPGPVRYDSEVLAMEGVAAYLGRSQDGALYAYFRRHSAHVFPRLRHVHRTTFVRQAANLGRVKERLGQVRLDRVPHDPQLAILDSLPLYAGQFARAPRGRRFRGAAADGTDQVVKPTCYGFRWHARVCWPGVLPRRCLAPANLPDPAAAPMLTAGPRGVALGDRRFWRPPAARRVGPGRRPPAGPLLPRHARSLARPEPPPQPPARSHCHRLRPTGRARGGQAPLGARLLAPSPPPAAPRPDAYARRLLHRSTQSAAASPGGAGRLARNNLHIGLANYLAPVVPLSRAGFSSVTHSEAWCWSWS
jgi:hypothetical protein